MKHKHAEAIKAWADGARIQFKFPRESEWSDIEKSMRPSWDDALDYRVKPADDEHHHTVYKHVSYTAQHGMVFVDEWPHNVRFVFSRSGQLLSVDYVHGW